MKLVEKLGIKSTGVYLINSPFGVGKTTITCVLSGELYLMGKNVLYLTEDTGIKQIQRKLVKIIDVTNEYRDGGVLIKKHTDLKKAIDSALEKQNFDVIIADGSISDIDYEYCKRISQDKNAIMIITNTVNTNITGESRIGYEFKGIQSSDMIINIARKKEVTLLESMKYGWFFWLKRPNRTIKIIKNRFGKESSFDVNIDFEKIKVK